MEKRIAGRSRRGLFKSMALSILPALLTAAVLLLLAAVWLDRFSPQEETVRKVIYAVHFLAAFACGFVMGKQKRERKFLWGLLSGGTWFVLILLVSLIFQGGTLDTGAVLPVLFACAGGSMAGGMMA
ncbi:MAG: TIGR04086 family membrane protein [Lachnospiraceae bacterium]|nr:TIGR04086 family membrane protein [Lachnospiraceae bacterium]